MIQNILSIALVLVASGYLIYKYIPRRSKKIQSKSSSCGCGSSCPLGKK